MGLLLTLATTNNTAELWAARERIKAGKINMHIWNSRWNASGHKGHTSTGWRNGPCLDFFRIPRGQQSNRCFGQLLQTICINVLSFLCHPLPTYVHDWLLLDRCSQQKKSHVLLGRNVLLVCYTSYHFISCLWPKKKRISQTDLKPR